MVRVKKRVGEIAVGRQEQGTCRLSIEAPDGENSRRHFREPRAQILLAPGVSGRGRHAPGLKEEDRFLNGPGPEGRTVEAHFVVLKDEDLVVERGSSGSSPHDRDATRQNSRPQLREGQQGGVLQVLVEPSRQEHRTCDRVGPMKATGWGNRALVLALGMGLSLTGCDEKKEEAPVEKAAPAPENVVPPPPTAPAPEPEKEVKPKKKLEDCAAGPKVVLENADLEASIRLKAQKPEGDLTTADLKKLRSLNLSRVSLDELDICLFHHMTSLRELFLGPGQVTDLGPISGATDLESLRVSMNPVEDLSPLAKMKKMDRLDLGKTAVKDLSPLKDMVLMTELMLDGAPVEDVSALSGMTKLEKLSVAGTQVKDIKALAELKKLEFLYIKESPLADDISATGVVAKNGTKVVQD